MAVGSGGGGAGGRAGGIKAGRAYVEITGDDSKLNSVLGGVRKTVLGLSKSLAVGGAGLAGLGTAVLAPIAASFQEVLGHFDQFTKASDRTGATVESLSALTYAAEQSDASLGDVANGLRFLQRNLLAASEGGTEAQEAFSRLGLSWQEMQRLSPEEQLAAIADATKGLDPTAQGAALEKLLGRGARALLPMLKDGGDALLELARRAELVGDKISGEDARNATKIGDQLNDTWKALKNTFRAVGAALLPQVDTITAWTEGFLRAVKHVRDFINENRGLVLGVTAAGAALLAAGGALLGLSGALAVVGLGITGLTTIIGALGAVAAVVFSPVGLGIATLGAAAVALAEVAAELGLLDEVAERGGRAWASLSETFGTTWQGIKDAISAGDWKLAFEVGLAGLKVTWLTFIAELQAAWDDFGGGFRTWWRDFTRETEIFVMQLQMLARLGQIRGKGIASIGIKVGKVIGESAKAMDELTARWMGEDFTRAAANVFANLGGAGAPVGGALADARRELAAQRAELAGAAGAARTAAVLAANDRMMDRFLRDLMGAAGARRQDALAGVFGATRGQFGGAGLAQALGIGPGSVQEKQLDEAKKANEHLERIEENVGGLPAW